MKRAILLLAVLACSSSIGCNTRSGAKLILALALNSEKTQHGNEDTAAGSVAGADTDQVANAGANFFATSEEETVPLVRRPHIDELVAAMWELDQLRVDAKTELAEVNGLIERIAESVANVENSTASRVLVQQVRDA